MFFFVWGGGAFLLVLRVLCLVFAGFMFSLDVVFGCLGLIFFFLGGVGVMEM